MSEELKLPSIKVVESSIYDEKDTIAQWESGGWILVSRTTSETYGRPNYDYVKLTFRRPSESEF